MYFLKANKILISYTLQVMQQNANKYQSHCDKIWLIKLATQQYKFNIQWIYSFQGCMENEVKKRQYK